MFRPDQYQLIDFGDGRKLERLGPFLLARPCPLADGSRRVTPGAWRRARARYERSSDGRSGRWLPDGALPDCWTVTHGPVTFELKPTRVGHLGLFPEQAPCWDWIAERVSHAGRPLKVLNLFAYTGGSTLAAAAAGAAVVHVDAASSTVGWARRNAGRSGLAGAPIRWIVEDALRFATRELRRGNKYDAVILDPPTYGHGPGGESWKLADYLPQLLRTCGALTAGRLAFVLLTCHTPAFGPAALADQLAAAVVGDQGPGVEVGPLQLSSMDGRILPSGAYAHWAEW